MRNIKCYSYHEKGHYSAQCLKKGSETVASTANNKVEQKVVVGRGYLMSEEEEKTTHNVIVGTLLVDSNVAHTLFDLDASYSFVSHDFVIH